MSMTLDELTMRFCRCVGIWETNRGGNDPMPVESRLDTVAGVHASMATIEQATMPYAIDGLKRNPPLREKATPKLTIQELNDAEARCVAVKVLIGMVDAAAAAGQSAAAFIAAHPSAISESGLGESDVRTMFDAVALRKTIDGLHAKVISHVKTIDQAVASIANDDRLGLGTASLKSYITNPEKRWGENRAGWQRKAVNMMANDVGGRVNQVAVSSNGQAFALIVYRAKLKTRLGTHPIPDTKPDLRPIIMEVAQTNNSNEVDYGLNVWKNYDRLY